MTSLKQAISLQQQTIKSSRNQQIMYGLASATYIHPHNGAHYVTAGKATQNPSTLIVWLFSRIFERRHSNTLPGTLRSATLMTKIGDTTMTETTTAVENAMPHRTKHHTRKSAHAADLDHSIVQYHTHVSRTPTKLTFVGTRAVTETNGQKEPSDTSEQGIKYRRHRSHRK
jgi:hypothetical protein